MSSFRDLKKMRLAGIPKSAVDFALSDICVPLCILKTSYYIPACEKKMAKLRRGGRGRGHLQFSCVPPPQELLSEILPCIVPPYNEMGYPPLHSTTDTHTLP